jgi:4-hydroxy-tetrahydrodipicolinate synthase
MTKVVNGIIPVMLTPFLDSGEVDYGGLRKLTDWYIANGADALFAVCQSSEMQFLSLEERVAVGKAVVEHTAGRVPVLVSGHISDDMEAQIEELNAMARVGADVLVLVTNHLDPSNAGGDTARASIERILAALPADTALGLYECPAPYRRLMTDDELRFCANSGRFVVIKDVSCDLDVLKRRKALVAGSPLTIVNANAAVAFAAMKAGLDGFCGVMTNLHPDLYKWLLGKAAAPDALSEEVASILSLAAMSEAYGYPALAKLYHQRIGTFASIRCRVSTTDLRERVWAVDPLLDHITFAAEAVRARIAASAR